MEANARVAVERHHGRDRLVDVRCEPPLTIRRCDDRILLVGSAAAPVGGDRLSTAVRVGPGARAIVGSAAAMIVWPGPRGEASSSAVCAEVGDGGHLSWQPEPLVSVDGSAHRAATNVHLAATATCAIVEEIALGRVGEPSGTLELALRIERGGAPLLVHAERFGPDVAGAGSLAAAGAARYVIFAVVVGPPARASDTALHGDGGPTSAVLPIARDASIAVALGPDRPATWSALDAVAPTLADAIDSRA